MRPCVYIGQGLLTMGLGVRVRDFAKVVEGVQVDVVVTAETVVIGPQEGLRL